VGQISVKIPGQFSTKINNQAGDMVIRTIAQRLSAVIGEQGIVARIGGDEFIALLHHATNKVEIMMICDNLIESVCKEINYENIEICVGASVGVAWWPEDAITADTVIRSADQALYRAKALGRGRAVRADEPVAEFKKQCVANA
jgi:diguanylate cyclase (GGDEF)-like protein